MPNVISFQNSIERTEGKDRALLLGNGFSIRHFSYNTLLEKADLEKDDPLRALFNVLKTSDFEVVIKALEDASVVEAAYGNKQQSDKFDKDANRLREALVHAIRTTHPAHRDDIADEIPSCSNFLEWFGRILTLNYDLLLYWIILNQTKSFQDGFGLGEETSGFRGPFKREANCNIYNLHGGLHLFLTETGEVEKRIMGPNGVIEAIAETILRDKHLPIYVAEGTSRAKLRKINSIPYLKYCYEKLAESSGSFFVYGSSARPNDEHIYRALFESRIDHLYFCIHLPTANVQAIDGELARYKRLYNSQIKYTFVDAESARVWDAQGNRGA